MSVSPHLYIHGEGKATVSCELWKGQIVRAWTFLHRQRTWAAVCNDTYCFVATHVVICSLLSRLVTELLSNPATGK